MKPNMIIRGARLTLFLLAAAAGLSARAQLFILEQPVSQTNVDVGADVAFTVTASSTVSTNLQYQWRRNGVNLAGATNSALLLFNVQATNGGAYSVAVSDGMEAVNSAPAILTADVTVVTADDYPLNQIGSTSGVLRGSNVGAAKLPGEPTILPGHNGGHPIWFSWTPPFSGIATLSTAGSDFETMVGVYAGTTETNVTAVSSAVNNADKAGFYNGKVSFNAVVGTEYQIVVDGYHGESGDVVLTWSENITSDTLATFKSMPPDATAVPPMSALTFSAPYDTGSLEWLLNGTPTGMTNETISISAADDATVGKYTAQVTSPAGNTTSTRGAELQTCVLEDGSTATNSFAWKKFLDAVASPYPAPTAATPVTLVARRLDGGDTRGFSISQVFSTVGAHSEPGEPNPCGQLGGSPEWYAYVTPTNGALAVNTAGSGFNTILAVFTGPGNSLSTLTNIGCGYTTNFALNGQPQLFFPSLPANQTNYIMVDGENGASGTVHLYVGLGTPVAITSAPQNQFVAAGSNATFSVSATGSAPISYVWQRNGTNIPGATNSSLTLTNAQAAQQGLYTVVVSNVVWTTSSSAALTLLAAPAITTPPASQTAGSNATVTLGVTATGAPAPDYQWYFNGAGTGTDSNLLQITNFGTAKEGNYWVVASNSAGTSASPPATVLLNAPVRIGSFVLTNGGFQLQLAGSAGSNYFIQVSTNLTNWTPVLTNTTPNGLINFTDTNLGGRPLRFYRAVGQ
jgi:hypothetical protein